MVKKKRKKKHRKLLLRPTLAPLAPPFSGLLQLLHQVVPGSGARQPRPAVPLEVERGELAVDDDRGVPLRPLVAERALGVEHDVVAERARELAARVREHRDPGLLRAARLAPRGHHERVVDGDEHDGVRARGLELRGLVDRAGHVALVARRREGPGDGEEGDLLAERGELDLVPRGGAVERDVGDGVAGLFLSVFLFVFFEEGFFDGWFVGVEFFLFFFSMDRVASSSSSTPAQKSSYPPFSRSVFHAGAWRTYLRCHCCWLLEGKRERKRVKK